ncbi:4801_t:CDS:1, partial [Dentiscutata heterogama]
MSVISPVLYFIRTENDSDCFILKIDETCNWQIDSGSARFPSYQYFKAAVSKRKITNFKGFIITSPRKNYYDAITRFFKEFFSPKGIHAKDFPNLDFHVILTEGFRNKQIFNILRENGFEFYNNDPKFKYQNKFMEFFFNENVKPLILKHNKSVEQDANAIGYCDSVKNNSMMRNNAEIQTDLSSILTYLQYINNDIKKSIFLTSDNVASWVQNVLITKLNQEQPDERPSIDIFQVPKHGSRINSIVTGTYVNPPKYVHQQFALMVILYYGGQFDFKGLYDKTAIDIEADFEIMLNFTNFEIFKKAALLQGYMQTLSNPITIKNFLKYMAKALIIRCSAKDTKVDWNWNEINWPKVARKLYIIYKMNQTIESRCWPKYDFIKDIVDIPKKDNLDPYFNNRISGDIIEEQLYSYFNSIKERIYKNFVAFISINHKKRKHRPQYTTLLRPLLNPMWNSLDTFPL